MSKIYYEGGRAVQFDDYGHEYTVSRPNLRAYAAWYMTLHGQFTEHARQGASYWCNEQKRLVFIMAKSEPTTIKLTGGI